MPPCSFYNGKDVVASLAGNAWARWFSSSSYAFDVCPGGTSAWVASSLSEELLNLSRKYDEKWIKALGILVTSRIIAGGDGDETLARGARISLVAGTSQLSRLMGVPCWSTPNVQNSLCLQVVLRQWDA